MLRLPAQAAPRWTAMKRGDGRTVTYGFGELNMLVPAYAATIHKSQGSE
jgi:ATP-dependent exoDNAse (exonuclease V) alpha subunit